MAPSKASKRATAFAAAPASPKKKSRVDPLEATFEGIITTLQDSDDLNEHCRQMLVGMVRPSLSKAKSERHDMQQLGVTMVEEALQSHKTNLIAAVEVAQKQFSDLEGSKSALLQRVDDTKALLAEKAVKTTTASAAHDAAQGSTKAAEQALEEAKALETQVQKTHAVLEKERVAIDAAYQEHFKAPMENNQGPHHHALKPFIECLGFEESLMSALPSSCVKTKEQRGGFDDLVLTELGKALLDKIGQYEKSLEDASLAISECKEGTASAEEALADRSVTEKTAAENLEAAKAAQSDAELKVAKASEEWIAFEPQMHAASDNYNLHESKRVVFEDGLLKSFEALREKDIPALVETEASVAGA